MDKIPQIKTVVNKVNEIDNTYRNFQFEVLAGLNDTNVTCKENGCEFKFDFAKVYWNPRLGTEHERVVNLLKSGDVLYDIFAGVGPFSIPAVSKRRVDAVLANDLNPESYRYLIGNYTQNNKSKLKKKEQESRRFMVRTTKQSEPILPNSIKFDLASNFSGFNLDGCEFIQTKLKYHLIEINNYRVLNEMTDLIAESKFYALMNLPAMSIEFLHAFRGLYDTNEIELIEKNFKAEFLDQFRLNVFCYHFCKGDETELEKIKNSIKNEILGDSSLDIDSKYVRKVAPNKNMYCSMFKLGFKNFFMKKSSESNGLKNKISEVFDESDCYERENKIQKTE